MTTFVVSMQPNQDGRRKTTKLEADDYVVTWRDPHWLLQFTKGESETEEEIIAEFVDPESWMLESVSRRVESA